MTATCSHQNEGRIFEDRDQSSLIDNAGEAHDMVEAIRCLTGVVIISFFVTPCDTRVANTHSSRSHLGLERRHRDIHVLKRTKIRFAHIFFTA